MIERSIKMINVFFLHQIKHTSGSYDKGIVVKDLARQEGESDEDLSKRNYEAAKQGYHAYLGAYAYGQSATTDFVSCEITDLSGARLLGETWSAQAAPET
jgi:hypothetical protein